MAKRDITLDQVDRDRDMEGGVGGVGGIGDVKGRSKSKRQGKATPPLLNGRLVDAVLRSFFLVRISFCLK